MSNVTSTKFTFETPEVIEAWAAKTGKFAKNQDAAVDVVSGTFQSGEIKDASGKLVMRMVKPKAKIENSTVPGWALIRLWDEYLTGHTFMREHIVGVIPNKAADHEANKSWYHERIQKALTSQIADWNKIRTAIAIRGDMINYGKIFGVKMPGVSNEEAAFITRMRIFAAMQPQDIDNVVKSYEKLYGAGCIGADA